MPADLSLIPHRVYPSKHGERIFPTNVRPSQSVGLFRPTEEGQEEKVYLSRLNGDGAIHVVPIWKSPEGKPYVVMEITKRLPFSDRLCLEMPGGVWRQDESPEQTLNRVLDSELSLQMNQHHPKVKVLNDARGIAKSPGIINELMYSVVAEVEGPKPENKKSNVKGHVLVPLNQYLDNQKFEDFMSRYENFESVLAPEEYKTLKVGMDVNIARGLFDTGTLWKLDPLLAIKTKLSVLSKQLGFGAPGKVTTTAPKQDIPYPQLPDPEGVLKLIHSTQKSNIFAPVHGTDKERGAWVTNHANGVTAAVHDLAVIAQPGERRTLDSLRVPLEVNFRRPLGNVIELPAGKWEPNKEGQKTAVDALNTELREETGLEAVATTILGGREYATSTGITGESKVMGLTLAQGNINDEGRTVSEMSTITDVPTVTLREFLDPEALQKFANERQAVVGADVIAAKALLTQDAFKRIGL